MRAVQQIMLGTMTGNEAAARQTLTAIRAAGYEGIELNGFMIRRSSFLVRALTRMAGMPTGRGGKLDWHSLLQEADLRVPAIHEDLGTISRDPNAVTEEAKSFSTGYVVITGMYRFDYSDEAALQNLCKDLNHYGKILAGEGIGLLYHNHNAEFRKVRYRDAGEESQVTAYDYILQHTDPAVVNFELDTYWPTEAGVNALALMEKVGRRMKLWHINDRGTRITGPSMTPIVQSDAMELGYGNMDLESLSARAKELSVSSVILETHRNFVDHSPIRSIEKSAAFMNTHFER
ncbi:Sugar phosphate isomerase/epimerase [Lachnospiraceae bacterium NK3A20]|nr:Sugar phosphate isomerase/epimerase [Lachnospiraceae bacterium NK3A20]